MRASPGRAVAPGAPAPMQSLAARHVFVGPGWLSPGQIVWDAAGVIRAVRAAPAGARVHDLALLPALVNAHAHLQLPSVGAPPKDFLAWIARVMQSRASESRPRPEQLARKHLDELLRSGCTAVGEIDSVGTSPSAIAATGFAGRCYQEVTGFHLAAKDARTLLRQRAVRADSACATGWSPHAPYSVSTDLFHACRARRLPMTVHAAELPEEQRFLREGTGPFRDLLERLGRLPRGWSPPRMGAIRWLQSLGMLGPRTLLVHCQELERGDAARIAEHGSPIVVCPGTIEYFGRSSPPVSDWLRRGIRVALGTDSRASNRAMSMRAELALAARLWPGLSPEQVFAMATEHGSHALSHQGIGRIRRGARADFLAVRCADLRPRALLEAFVHGSARLESVWVKGDRRMGSRLQAAHG